MHRERALVTGTGGQPRRRVAGPGSGFFGATMRCDVARGCERTAGVGSDLRGACLHRWQSVEPGSPVGSMAVSVCCVQPPSVETEG